MSSPSNASDSITYLTCIGLGLFTALAQEPAQAGPVHPNGDYHLSQDGAALDEATLPTEMAASDPFSAYVPGTDSNRAAELVSPSIEEASGGALGAMAPHAALALPPAEFVPSLAYLRGEELGTENHSFTPELEAQPFDPAAPFVLHSPSISFHTAPQLTPPIGRSAAVQGSGYPSQMAAGLDLPRSVGGAVVTGGEEAKGDDSLRTPTYQAITTPPLMPVITIAEPTPTVEPDSSPIAAAPQAPLPAFDAADSFTYLQATPPRRPELAGIEVIETVPSTEVAIAPPATPAARSVEPLAAQLSAAQPVAEPLAQSPTQPLIAQSSSAVAQALETTPASVQSADLANPNRALTDPIVKFQAAFLYQDDDLSARGRLTAIYPITSYLLVGGSLDLTEGDAFIDSELEGVNINELYVTVAPPSIPNLRFTLGQIDLTSYFDRNSFAKDAVTHFFNPIFQTNPALATSGIGSRQGIVANWAATDDVRLAVSGFSSDRSISEFELDAVAAELGVRVGNAIIRGTYVNGRDAGADDGPADIFSLDRGNGGFGVEEGDREEAFGLNAEYFIPEANLGLFARYGHYSNRDADFDADTVSGGINFLDVFTDRDRLGLAYGQNLQGGDGEELDNADALELFYDFPIRRNFRVGFTLQQRDDFSETVAGFRIRSDFDILP